MYQQSQTGGIYQNNQQATVIVGAAGSLSINGFVLVNPYHQVLNGATQTNEVNWDDGNIRYALSSNNNGVFNEINVFDKAKANPFMGQFIPMEGDPEQPSCGTQQELTVQSLAAYVGTYNVAIKKNDPVSFENVTVKNTTLIVDANGKMTLDGQIANGVKYCANPNTVTNVTGLMVQLDKSDALGRSHVDFWPDNTVNGTDYTHAAEFRFFSGVKQGAGGGDSGVVSVNTTLCNNPPFQTQTAFGITANAYNGCKYGAFSDFSLTASDTNPFGTHANKGTPCQITKVGSLVTLTKGANSLTADMDGEAIDVIHVKSGNLADTDEQYEVIAKNNGGKRAIDVEIAKNGTVLSAHAMDVDAGIDLICLK